MTPVETLLAKLPDAKKNGDGWSARCPAHEDGRASLSIAEGDDGRALVKCHAGCRADAICAAVGLSVLDLMPTADTLAIPGKHSRNGKPSTSTYQAAKAAIAALERKYGKRSALWTYHDAQGDPIGVIVRWDKADGKEIRPVARHGDRWIIGGMPEPRPLYHLPDVVDADRVFVCEGEKATDAARAIGLTATTSAHGSQSPNKTDWSPLAGKDVVILPDNDEAGEEYADAVTAILAKLKPAPVAKVVELPELPEKGDIHDWLEARDAHDPGELWATIEKLSDEAPVVPFQRRTPTVERFRAFPTDALPEPIRGLVVGGAKSIGCDATMIALPLITGLASAIGATRRIRLKKGWCEPAVLWTSIVAESGSHKTPAQELALRPLRQLQAFRLEEYPQLEDQYLRNMLLYDTDVRAWKSKGRSKGEAPPEKPNEPSVPRYLVNDVTLEALAEQLSKNPRGLLCDCDELAGWLGSFDQYRGGKGADVSKWLSMHRAEPLLIDRKTGPVKNLFIKHAAVSVTGGIQPTTLRRALGNKHFENGLAARMLLAAPPKNRKVWNTACVDENVTRQVEKIYARLLALSFGTDDNDSPAPVDLPLTIEGQRVWVDFYDVHAQLQYEATGNYASALAKIEAVAARLALIVHFSRWAADDPSLESPDVVDAASMSSGVTMAQWFTYEARRVYAVLSETDEDRDQRRLIEWIERRGGSVTAREVQQGHRQYSTAEEANAALDQLVKAGAGQWTPTPAGQPGQPTRHFVLSAASTVYGNP